jgi:O-antigen/teichoic acid export membrane protein
MAITHHEHKKVIRGSLMTVLGGLAMALYQSADFVLSGVFGLANFGLYALAATTIELLLHLIISGFLDAVTYFAAKPLYAPNTGDAFDEVNAAQERERQLYRTLATAIFAPFVLASAAAFLVQVLAPTIHAWLWHDLDPLVVDLLTTAVWSLPALVLVTVPTEALKTHLEVKWSVGITQMLLPYLTGTLAIVLHLTTDMGIWAMSVAVLSASLLCVGPAFYAYTRVFSLRKTLRAIVRFDFEPQVFQVAFPQSLSMALSLGMVRMDTLVLSGICDAATLGVYALVVRVTQLIRLAKMAFSALFGPLVAKLHAAGDRAAIGFALKRFASFSGSLGLAGAIVLMAIYPDIVLLKQAQSWTYPRLFPWLLCVGPLMSCFFGFAANLLLMTGHARVLLINAVVSLSLNFGLNLWLARSYGILGAALATAMASFFVSMLQVVEMTIFERYAMPLRAHLRTLLAGAPSLLMVGLWHSEIFDITSGFLGALSSLQRDLGIASVALLLYLLAQFTLPGPSNLRLRLQHDG